MTIIKGNQLYCRVIDSVAAASEAKEALFVSHPLFRSLECLNSIGTLVNDRFLYPIVGQGYRAVGYCVAKSASLISEELGDRVKVAWRAPCSSAFFQAVSIYGQKLLQPIVSRKASQLPRLKPLSQLALGIARLVDIGLKDVSSIFRVFHRARQAISEGPHKAYVSDRSTISGKISYMLLSAFDKVTGLGSRVADLALRVFHAIVYKIRFGRPLLESLRDRSLGVARSKNYLIQKIDKQEEELRKDLCGGIASAATQGLLRFAACSSIQLLAGFALCCAAEAILPSMAGFGGQSVQWALKVASIGSLFAANLYVENESTMAFIKSFIDNSVDHYNPKEHSIFYKHNLVSAILRKNNTVNYIKKAFNS